MKNMELNQSSGFRLTSAFPKGEWFEFYHTPCLVCGKTGNCMLHKSQKKVACTRVESKSVYGKGTSNESYIHYLNGKKKYSLPKFENVHQCEKQSIEVLHDSYMKLIENINLEEYHVEMLKNDRKLTSDYVKINGYRTFPKNQLHWEMEALISMWEEIFPNQTWKGIPGFHTLNRDSDIIAFGGNFSGMMIPYKDHKGYIQGFQIRNDEIVNTITIKTENISGQITKQPNLVKLFDEEECIYEGFVDIGKDICIDINGRQIDFKINSGQKYFWISSANKENGTGSGQPFHVSLPIKKQITRKIGECIQEKSVWITEGALKGDIACQQIEKCYGDEELADVGDTVISVAGVGAWKPLLPVLKEMGVFTVNLAFDADAISNHKVGSQLKNFAIALKQEGIKVRIAMWDEKLAKGIDDLLLLNQVPRFLDI